ncbi:MAG: Rap1a/Tai family immunity protein [Pseudomonas sp.]|uniref:Rap1a/Tai family immunity protein n=1 Tax=Pseudomonas sp. TaxID=306 RepID=UPI003C789614
MKKIIKAMALTMALILPTVASADYGVIHRGQGIELAQDCLTTERYLDGLSNGRTPFVDGEDGYAIGNCVNTVNGAAHTLVKIRAWIPYDRQTCFPETFATKDVIPVVRKFIEDNPSLKREDGVDAAIAALRAKFPCPAATKGKGL